MAKDSLIRSYENEIKNLKHIIQDLKGINKMEKEHLESVIKELKEKIKTYNHNINVNSLPQ